MTLDDLIRTIRTSQPNNWYSLDANTAFFKQRIVMTGSIPITDQHFAFASFKKDLSITMGWDLVDNDNFIDPYANNNPDTHSKSMWLDVFFNDALVFRLLYISVDGGRMNLPIPTNTNGVWEVSNEHADFIYILNGINGASRVDYDNYLGRNHIVVVNRPWEY